MEAIEVISQGASRGKGNLMSVAKVRCRRSSGRAFTLLELLVCITIVMIVMAMLLPFLKMARERARIVICRARLKQWGWAYANYASIYKDFLGGVAAWELRDCMSSVCGDKSGAFVGWPPDWGSSVGSYNGMVYLGGTAYEGSPWGKSTIELGKLLGVSKVNTECPSRAASDYWGGSSPVASIQVNAYGEQVGVTAGTQASYHVYNSWHIDLWSGASLMYIDFVVLAGFSDDPLSSIGAFPITPVTGTYNPYWDSDYGQDFKHSSPADPTGATMLNSGHDWWKFYSAASSSSQLYGPVTTLRQKRSLRSPLVMDRHYTINSNATYTYNDIGNRSNHGTFARYNTSVYPFLLASGSNALLLDMSVTWTPYDLRDSSRNTEYVQDFCRHWYVGENLKPTVAGGGGSGAEGT